ncbi:amidase [Nocardioides sp. LHG3406-4]|uniref:amidase n=1 Tax=Nocardioides sp. LHG3406-4 TaxID=2804575 RepID=UPI003CF53B02
MTHSLDLAYLDALTMGERFRSRDLSPVEVVDAVHTVVEAREPYLNAFHVRSLEDARASAEASEQRWRDGTPLSALDGVPITLKENIARVGVPMAFGNAGVTPKTPDRSAPTTLRVERAGLVLLGSTVMPDWGMLSSGVSSLHGVTRSPLDLRWTTGGSSSGAGAAAAGGYGPIHMGTDIGGSIRLPSAWLGLCGLKPSFGRVPLDSPYLARVVGPMARTVRELTAIMEIVAGFDPVDYTALPPAEIDWNERDWDPQGLRVGLLLDAGCGGPTDPVVRAAVEECARVFEGAGAVVEPLLPFMSQELLDALDLFWRVRSWVDHRALGPEARNRVLPYVANWCTAGSDTSGADVMRCYQAIMEIQQLTTRATERFDVVLSPVAPVNAFAAEEPMPYHGDQATMHHIGFTAPYSLSGQPAVSVNCGFTDDRRPIGVQLAGRRFDDAGVLRASEWYEQARPPSAAPAWPSDQVVPSHWSAHHAQTQERR